MQILLLTVAAVFVSWGASDPIAAIQTIAIQTMVEAGNLSSAHSALETALRSHPTDPALWNLLGIVDAQENKSEAAQEAFRRAVQVAPRMKSAWLNLGRIYSQSDDPKALDKGLASYESVLRIDPANAEAHHQEALLLLWKGRFSDSITHLNRLPLQDRMSRSVIAMRCADEAGLGNTKTALSLADQLLQVPELEQADVLAVLPAVRSRSDEVALRLLEGLKARGLASAEILLQLAAEEEKHQELAAARETYDKAFRMAASPQALIDLARVASKQKDFEGALGYLAHARELQPENPLVHFYFGLTCNELKLPFEARTSLKKALDLAPEEPAFNYAMGALELQWADKSLAISYLEKFVKLRPADARGHLALATGYFGLDRYKEARTELQLVERQHVTQAGAKYLLGRIAEQDGDKERAIAYFTEVAGIQPNSPEVHADLGSLFLEKQDVPAASRETRLALSLDPNNYRANSIQLRLYQQAKDPRLADQIERMKHITQNRDAELALLQRGIQVSPW